MQTKKGQDKAPRELEFLLKTITRSLIIAGYALIASLKTQAAVDDESPLAAQALPLLYVANASDSTGQSPGFVTAYDPGSCGSVSPILTIRGTNTLILDDQTLAFDRRATFLCRISSAAMQRR